MAFLDAIKTCFRKYVVFSGRATRAEFWYFVLFTFIVSLIAAGLDNALGLTPEGAVTGILSSLAGLALLLPSLAVTVRRLHDVNRSGWWILLALVLVIGDLFLIFAFYIKKSVAGANRFGPDPLVATRPTTAPAPVTAPAGYTDGQLTGTPEA
ncbi:DUF805 domain-containing protein [Raineyella sp.]|uniref:Inner membrane protein YhaH n=1 Tax=bioreactor metagenome TaxID=1076179 RepID=A0A644YBJ7_9ZZZZ|nr:DUF805 domain-containing protein [Raineyella sp.]MEA5153196.1 DUF805 domain-containing protein [Raineyella sp.]